MEAGLKDEAEGRLVPHEKVFGKYAKKTKRP
jgi:predicted transcriptional regulator